MPPHRLVMVGRLPISRPLLLPCFVQPREIQEKPKEIHLICSKKNHPLVMVLHCRSADPSSSPLSSTHVFNQEKYKRNQEKYTWYDQTKYSFLVMVPPLPISRPLLPLPSNLLLCLQPICLNVVEKLREINLTSWKNYSWLVMVVHGDQYWV